MTSSYRVGFEDVRRESARLVDSVPLFQGLEPGLRAAIVEAIEWFVLPGGTTLFEAGEPSDAMYCVLSGSLGAYAATENGQQRLVGRIAMGETVGEMGIVSGNPRNATVVALRDSELGRLPRATFEKLLLNHAQGLLPLLRLMIRRLDSAQQRPRAQHAASKTFAIVPHGDGLGVRGFATRLASCLKGLGRTELVSSQHEAERTTDFFHSLERNNEFVVYLCDVTPTRFSKLCLRQADSVLLVAHARETPSEWPALRGLQDRGLAAQGAELLLLHDERVAPAVAKAWLDLKPGLPHHHVRSRDDVARVARLLTGHSTGVVLSGGGARGFAHIGVLRALREAGVTIDSIGGTSIGAVIAAAYACEWSHEELQMRVRRCFVDTNPVDDYTLPLVSLVAGRKVERLLRREFGNVAIEDLPLPLFCVSTNLSSGRFAVHRRGDLSRWLRASVAIPGILPPIVEGGELFVDGGTINNLPVDVMREAGLGRVIGVDVGSDRALTVDAADADSLSSGGVRALLRGRRPRIDILKILVRAGTINSVANTASGRNLADLLLQPPLEQIDMLNWRAFDRAIEAGYRYASERLRILGDFAASPSSLADQQPRD